VIFLPGCMNQNFKVDNWPFSVNKQEHMYVFKLHDMEQVSSKVNVFAHLRSQRVRKKQALALIYGKVAILGACTVYSYFQAWLSILKGPQTVKTSKIFFQSVAERRMTKRRMFQHRLTERRRIIQRRMTERRMIQHRMNERRLIQHRITEPKMYPT
jgi:hypothetical protein